MKFIIKSKRKTGYFTGGCFGAVGRTDWNACYKPAYQAVLDANDRTDMGTKYPSPYSSTASWRCSSVLGRAKPVYLILPYNFQSESRSTFHIRNKGLMYDLVHNSIWSPCFVHDAAYIMQQEEVHLHCVGVSSELVIAAGYILRMMDKPSFTLNYKAIKSACPELTVTQTILLATIQRDLYRGSGIISADNADGYLTRWYSDIRLIANDAPILSNLDIKTVGGYIMNITGMWQSGYSRPEEQFWIGAVLDALVAKHSKPTQVQGVFGSMTVNGIVDLRSYLLDVHKELQEYKV